MICPLKYLVDGEAMVTELISGVILFCWEATIPASIRDERSLSRGYSLPAGATMQYPKEPFNPAAAKLCSTVIPSLKTTGSFRILNRALLSLVREGDDTRTMAFFKQTDTVQRLLSIAISNEDVRSSVLKVRSLSSLSLSLLLLSFKILNATF